MSEVLICLSRSPLVWLASRKNQRVYIRTFTLVLVRMVGRNGYVLHINTIIIRIVYEPLRLPHLDCGRITSAKPGVFVDIGVELLLQVSIGHADGNWGYSWSHTYDWICSLVTAGGVIRESMVAHRLWSHLMMGTGQPERPPPVEVSNLGLLEWERCTGKMMSGGRLACMAVLKYIYE